MNKRFITLEHICRANNIATLYVFGSRAHEVYAWLQGATQMRAPSASDVDLGAKPLPGVVWDVRQKTEIAQLFEELFGVERVDFLPFDDADPFVSANIVRGERLYAADSYAADEYELYVLRRAGDLVPLERERLALIFGV